MIKTRKNKFVLVCLVTLLSMSCARKIDISAPTPGVFTSKPAVQESVVLLPLSANIAQIRTKIEQLLPRGEVFRDGERISNTTRYEYSVRRDRNISFTAVGSELRFMIPLQINAKGWYTVCTGYWHNGKCRFGATHTRSATTSVAVNVHLRITPKVNSNYKVTSKVVLDARLGNNPHIHFRILDGLVRFNISIKDKLEPELRKLVNRYNPRIQKAVNDEIEKIDLRGYVANAWDAINTSLPIDDSGFYLNSEGKKLYFQNIHGAGGKINTMFGFAAQLEISDESQSSDNVLPKLSIITPRPGKFAVHLPTSVQFTTITDLVNDEVAGKVFEKDNHRVRIRDVSVSGVMLSQTKSAILVATRFRVLGGLFRSAKGTLYLTMIPAYDQTNDVVYVQDFVLTPETNNVLIDKGLPWLTDKFFYEDIKSELQYDFTDEKDEYTRQLGELLRNVVLGPLTVHGSLNANSPSFDGIYIDQDQLMLLLRASGSLTSDPINVR